jgi:hypothetical protein
MQESYNDHKYMDGTVSLDAGLEIFTVKDVLFD